MKAVHLDTSGLHFTDSYPEPERRAGEAKIDVRMAGICSTDLELVKGYFGFEGVLGHEFVGVVREADNPTWIGKRVVSSINFADCNSPEFKACPLASGAGGLEHYPGRTVLGILKHDGAMAESVCVPETNLYEVPQEVSDRQAVFTEPLAAALRIPQQLDLSQVTNAAVLGPGRLGMLIAKVLDLSGPRVTVFGRSATSLDLPRRWGLSTMPVSDAPHSHFDLVVDATGSPTAFETAIAMTKPLGVLVLKSTFEGSCPVNLTKLVVDEIRLIGSRCGPFDQSLKLLQRQCLRLEDLIDGETSIENAIDAFEQAGRPGVRKILLHVTTE